ncbi:hypothetical protein BpHYR1_018043 [Brachionus plicatilis]|uniref:Uncharacterized protein n=1 Tax=Brachionus plicatilis TaxID=10195 RepID=A0A3M7RQ17_BRAPC|nr:hypothetical protein BpHYR1_018043 [Brachionus plicatilis]
MLSNLIFINTNRSFFDGFFNDLIQKLLIIFLAAIGMIKVYHSTHLIQDLFKKILNHDSVKNIIVDADFMQELKSIPKSSKKCPKTLKLPRKKNLSTINESLTDDEITDQLENLNYRPGCCELSYLTQKDTLYKLTQILLKYGNFLQYDIKY